MFIRTKELLLDLVNFMKSEADAIIEYLTIYFPVTNLHIIKPFKIGDVEITYFTKEYFDKLWAKNTKENRTEKEFNELYRKYQGRVFASYTLKAESNKAQEISFQKCLQAIDLLKLFCPTVIIPEKRCYMGIEGNLNFNFQSDFISIPVNDRDAWRFSMSARNDPFVLSDDLIEDSEKAGLSLLSKFIISKKG